MTNGNAKVTDSGSSSIAANTALGANIKLHQKFDKTTGQAIHGQYVLVDSTTTNAVKVYDVELAGGATGNNGTDKTLDIKVKG